ncbi:unnamed protein product, partial [Ixodes pacificus]
LKRAFTQFVSLRMERCLTLLIVSSMFHSSTTRAACSDCVVVSTGTGSVRGVQRTTLSAQRVQSFTGIPYAKAPVGELRFRKPVPVEPWEGVLDATRTPPTCMQTTAVDAENLIGFPYDMPESEDCLYLNIWAPEQNTSKKRHVMVWIYGGGLIVGSASLPLYDGSILSTYGDVVVVSINYRLGAFGFLFGGTDDVPGNQGLHDQALALAWISDNIERFGGDPKLMTLFGQSAGAWSVQFHLLSPITQSMVHRAITHSGGVDQKEIVASSTSMLERAHEFAEFLGCSGGNNATQALSAASISCLQNANATLLSVAERLFTNGAAAFFQPVYGDSFMPVEPRQAEFPGDKDVLLGHLDNEGAFFIYQDFRDSFSMTQPARKINKADMNYFVGEIFSGSDLSTLQRLQEEYMGHLGDFDYDGLRRGLAEMRGDSHIVCATLGTARKLADATALNGTGAGVYYYKISRGPRCSQRQSWFDTTHGDELAYVFGIPFMEGGCILDADFSRVMMTAWTEFAKTG